MSWLDSKFISLLSGRLQKFKRKSAVLFNFRCPMCGDSEKNKNKARAYFYQRDGAFWFHCHNCSVAMPFFRFLKQFDGGLYHEYQMEKLGDQHHRLVTPQQERLAKPRDGNDALKSLEPISGLPKNQIAYSYCVDRGIPKPFFKELYYCFDFKTWTNLQIPGKLADSWPDEARLIIPFFDPQGNMFAFQGRALEDVVNNLRYITIFLDETKPKIWGWNRVNFNASYYVTEGPFDAMFLSNSIATAGGKITSELYKIGCNIDNAVVAYDNEPRNSNVVANVRAAVKQNFRVVIWPSNYAFKDINDCVLGGYDVEKILRENTYQGLSAEIEFNRWRKI